MAMNDEETVALIAGGPHVRQDTRRADADTHVGREPRRKHRGAGSAGATALAAAGAPTRSRAAGGAWTKDSRDVDNNFFDNLFGTSGSS